MKLSNGIEQAFNRRWSMINTFTIQIYLSNEMASKVGWFSDEINLNVISFNTPDFTNDPIASWVANKWMIHNGRDQLYRFNMTLRDQNQMALYKKFLEIYKETRNNYFDTVAMQIVVIKDPDWIDEADSHLMTLGGCLIEGISNLSFNNTTENQIAEFTLSFRCNKVTIG